MSHDIFDDWRYRYSQLYLSDGKWYVWVKEDDNTWRISRRWRWWNPLDLARMGIHWLWVRRYW